MRLGRRKNGYLGWDEEEAWRVLRWVAGRGPGGPPPRELSSPQVTEIAASLRLTSESFLEIIDWLRSAQVSVPLVTWTAAEITPQPSGSALRRVIATWAQRNRVPLEVQRAWRPGRA